MKSLKYTMVVVISVSLTIWALSASYGMSLRSLMKLR